MSVCVVLMCEITIAVIKQLYSFKFMMLVYYLSVLFFRFLLPNQSKTPVSAKILEPCITVVM